MNQDLFTAVDTYISTLFHTQDDRDTQDTILHEMEAQGLPDGINISPVQGKLLHVLALLCRARTILEVGTLGGYSAIWMARALPPDGRLITLDNNPTHVDIARANIARAGLSDRIEVRPGNALDSLAQLVEQQAGPFDMVFLDADKPPMVEYFQWAMRLTHPGSLIVADNAVFRGEILNTATPTDNVSGIQQFLAALAADSRLTSTVIPMVGTKGYDGLAIAVVK